MSGVLNLNKNFLFVHVPKCAGSSVWHTLAELPGSRGVHHLEGLEALIKEENKRCREKVDIPAHARARDLRKQLGRDVYDGLETMAVVRNPWTRLASFYRYFRGQRRAQNRPIPPYLDSTLSVYALWACKRPLQSVADMVVGEDGAVIVKSLLRHETISIEFAAWCSEKIQTELDLRKVNVSERPEGELNYTPEAADAMRRAYARDFELFNYPLDPPAGV